MNGDSDSLRRYRGDLSALQTLSPEAERALAFEWRKGDARAGRQLIEACLPFVVAIAYQYRRWGVPMEDIIQQGNIGLLRAAKKFEPERKCRLATYAGYWIRAEIREYVVRSYRVVRLGTTKGERRALRAYRTMSSPTVPKLAEASGLSEERVRALLPVLEAREASLDASVGDMPSLGERFESDSPSPEENAHASREQLRAEGVVEQAIGKLSEREQLIVRERLMKDDPVTLQELGNRLGVSKERVRQLEERAKGKMREQLLTLREDLAA
jgi:RNA polymerase sigma-32 factor